MGLNVSGICGTGMVAVIPFRQIWCVDFEFRAHSGERPWPVCMVARELRSGRELRLWREELLALSSAPFDTGPEALVVAYLASAELGCFLELGWSMPANVLDLYVEHRVATNGLPTPSCGNGLVGVLPHGGSDTSTPGRRRRCAGWCVISATGRTLSAVQFLNIARPM